MERPDRHTVRINARDIHAVTVEDEHMRKIRASYYFIGALLGKYKSAEVPLPGGCTIGSRPIDQHLKGFRALGSDEMCIRDSPSTILFYNGGATITTEGSPSLDDLKNMEAQGVEILTCGTCLDYYNLKDKLAVGSVTNMYTIAVSYTHLAFPRGSPPWSGRSL